MSDVSPKVLTGAEAHTPFLNLIRMGAPGSSQGIQGTTTMSTIPRSEGASGGSAACSEGAISGETAEGNLRSNRRRHNL